MKKFILTNWQTVPLYKKYDWQLDRYIKVCVVDADNPQKVLFIVPLFGDNTGGGFSHLIEFVRNYEVGNQTNHPFSDLLEPVDGEIVDVPSLNGPLFRVFTKDEARYGICRKEDVGKVERTPTGKVKIYHSIKVFTIYIKDNETGNIEPLSGWEPEQMYRRFFGYNYRILSDLTEPLQL